MSFKYSLNCEPLLKGRKFTFKFSVTVDAASQKFISNID